MIAFMNGEKIVKTKNRFIGKSIGYSFRYYVNDIVSDGNLKMLSVDGIYPNIENIKSNTYPITDNFYAVYRKDDSNENIKKVIDWVISDEGQEIINETGYVGIK